jgi:hypothetical protein
MGVYLPGPVPASWSDAKSLQARRTNWWLRTTSSGWDRPARTIEEREKARRSRLTSWIILGLLVMLGLLAPLTLVNTTDLITVLAAAGVFVVAAALNRHGHVTAAGSMLIMIIVGGIFGTLVNSPPNPATHAAAGQLGLADLPAYDILAVAVVVAASILPRAAAFVVASLNIVLMSLDMIVQPKAPDLQALTAGPAIAGTILARPVALQVIIAVVAYLWVRGTDDAIRRADRAEEIAAMEHQLAEQKRQLDDGIRQILETHVRVANGDFSARAPLTQDNILFQIAASLNNLLNRLGRAGQAEYLYQRTAAEIERLRESLVAAKAGRPPLWPAPSGTPVDGLIDVIAGPLRPATSVPLPSMHPSSGMPGMSSVPMPSPGAPSSPWNASSLPDWPPPGFPNPQG